MKALKEMGCNDVNHVVVIEDSADGLNAALNEYAVNTSDVVDKAAALGVDKNLFYRASGKTIGTVFSQFRARLGLRLEDPCVSSMA